jgi:serine/threonine-protein kinase
MPADCPPALWRVIEKALQKTSALRYRGAEEMLRDLKAAEGSLNQPVVPPPVSASSHILAGPHQNPATAHLVPPPISTAGLTPAQAQLMNQVYGQAYGQSAASPAPQSAPYGQGYGQPYGQTPTYVPVPIYYPPPPRPITISPETRSCMGRFVWAVAIIGLLFAIVIYGIGALTETMDRNPGAAQSIPTTPQQAQARLEPSLDAARERAERIIAPPPEAREEATSGPTLQDAVGLVAAAMDEPNPARRAQLWSQSSQAFVAVGMSNPEGMDIVFAQAASVYMGAAEMGAQAGRFDRAIEALYQAEGFTNGNQDTAYEIQQRMNLYRAQM